MLPQGQQPGAVQHHGMGSAAQGEPPALAGVPAPESALVSSLERSGAFGRATLQGSQVLHPDALLALRVNGADLSPDHGFPARIIVPAVPGVHNTKWVESISFRAAVNA